VGAPVATRAGRVLGGAGGVAGSRGGGQEPAKFLPTPPQGIGGGREVGGGSCVSYVTNFLLSSFLSGQTWAEGNRGACKVPPLCRQRAGNADKMYATIV